MFLLQSKLQQKQTNNQRTGYLSVDSKYNRQLLDYKPANQRKRKPIFQRNKQQQYCNFFSRDRRSNPRTLTFGGYQQQLQLLQAYDNRINVNYDFCGCQDQISPCSIIEKSFLQNVSLADMKMQYEIIEGKNSVANIGITNNKFKELKKDLFKVLPAKYPQIFYSHLTTLLINLGIMKFTCYNFLALACIHYHCKVQYLTFFIYKDLQNSLAKGPKIFNLLQQGLAFYNSNYREICLTYSREKLQKFIQIYQQSIGAIMIPQSQYSIFLKILFEKGIRVLLRLLVNFLSRKKQEMNIIIQLQSKNQAEKLRLYLRELDWDSIFKLL